MRRGRCGRPATLDSIPPRPDRRFARRPIIETMTATVETVERSVATTAKGAAMTATDAATTGTTATATTATATGATATQTATQTAVVMAGDAATQKCELGTWARWGALGIHKLADCDLAYCKTWDCVLLPCSLCPSFHAPFPAGFFLPICRDDGEEPRFAAQLPFAWVPIACSCGGGRARVCVKGLHLLLSTPAGLP